MLSQSTPCRVTSRATGRARQHVVRNAAKDSSQTTISMPDGNPSGFSSPVERRRALLAVPALLAPLALQTPIARAGPVGQAIAGLWRGRQQANRDLIIAPIKVAQLRLGEAIQLMDSIMPQQQSGAALQPVLQAVRTSSLNCYVFESLPNDSLETRASLATQQFQFSDPCTFRLIVKNITGLSSDEQRKEGEELVAQLILSYQKLDGELEGAIQGSEEAGAAARDQLTTTVGYVNRLENFVQNILA